MGRPFLPRPLCGTCGKPCKRRDRQYCSRHCHAIADTGKPKLYMHGNTFAFKEEGETVWAHYKRMQKMCPPGPCVKCGTDKTVIHHKDHNPRNTLPENLERLCRSCHASHHHGEENPSMTSTPIPKNLCPKCGYYQDVASDPIGHAKPSAGDISICFECGAMLIFCDDLTQRECQPEDTKTFSPALLEFLTKLEAVKLEAVRKHITADRVSSPETMQ